MRSRRVVLLRETSDVVRQLAPEPKRKVRAALAKLQRDPELGEPLERELTGMRRVRVGQLRIVYRVSALAVEIVAIGPRRSIYTAVELEARRGVAERERGGRLTHAQADRLADEAKHRTRKRRGGPSRAPRP